MSTQKRKFELFARLQALGFTYEESAALRRIEMTLHRWAEAECNGEIEREEEGKYAGKPVRNSYGWVNGTSEKRVCWPIADREAGALRRLASIVGARNARHSEAEKVLPYHQTDPRGCALYIVRYASLCSGTAPIDQIYNRGTAVCA